MIELQNVSKQYRDTFAVRDLNCVIRPGHVTGLLGPNGAGKTTTLHMILGLIRPSTGRVRINGKQYSRLPNAARQLGAVLSVDTLNRQLTAGQHLDLIRTAADIDKSQVDACLQQTGIADAADKKIKTFSLGMKQRLGIAAALLGDPGILILDEPFNGLDAAGIRWLRGFVRDFAAKGRTVLLSSHLMREMEESADHIIVLSQGELLADASLKTLLKAAESDISVQTVEKERFAALLRSAGAAVTERGAYQLQVQNMPVDQVGLLAQQNDIALFELYWQKPSLEQVYFALTDRRSAAGRRVG